MPYYFQCHHIVLLPIWAFSSFFAFYLTNIGRNTAVDNRGEQCILITNTFSYDDSSNVVPPPTPTSLSLHGCYIALDYETVWSFEPFLHA